MSWMDPAWHYGPAPVGLTCSLPGLSTGGADSCPTGRWLQYADVMSESQSRSANLSVIHLAPHAESSGLTMTTTVSAARDTDPGAATQVGAARGSKLACR